MKLLTNIVFLILTIGSLANPNVKFFKDIERVIILTRELSFNVSLSNVLQAKIENGVIFLTDFMNDAPFNSVDTQVGSTEKALLNPDVTTENLEKFTTETSADDVYTMMQASVSDEGATTISAWDYQREFKSIDESGRTTLEPQKNDYRTDFPMVEELDNVSEKEYQTIYPETEWNEIQILQKLETEEATTEYVTKFLEQDSNLSLEISKETMTEISMENYSEMTESLVVKISNDEDETVWQGQPETEDGLTTTITNDKYESSNDEKVTTTLTYDANGRKSQPESEFSSVAEAKYFQTDQPTNEVSSKEEFPTTHPDYKTTAPNEVVFQWGFDPTYSPKSELEEESIDSTTEVFIPDLILKPEPERLDDGHVVEREQTTVVNDKDVDPESKTVQMVESETQENTYLEPEFNKDYEITPADEVGEFEHTPEPKTQEEESEKGANLGFDPTFRPELIEVTTGFMNSDSNLVPKTQGTEMKDQEAPGILKYEHLGHEDDEIDNSSDHLLVRENPWVHQNPETICKKHDYNADPYDKTIFYRCVPIDDTFLAYKFHCPVGLKFNTAINHCM